MLELASSWCNIKSCVCVRLARRYPQPLMRGNWIFIAFDDCHFSNKNHEELSEGREMAYR